MKSSSINISSHNLAPLAVTPGEPAGIGPDICLALATQTTAIARVHIASIDLMEQRAEQLGLSVSIKAWKKGDPVPSTDSIWVYDIPLNGKCVPGSLNTENARYVLNTLDVAIDGCLDGTFSGMVTAPVHKGIINDSGVLFQGHTEYLQHRCGVNKVVMMLASKDMRVALATTHLPLSEVSKAITSESLEKTTRILMADLKTKFAIENPKILVAGLNPHAGEGGHLGTEERDIIEPLLDKLRAEGADLVGPLPADTLFTQRLLENADAVLAMYHDQGLPVLKYQSFGEAINITLGLPIIRTSVDHGTALDLAGKGDADHGSLRAALALAQHLAKSSSQSGPVPV